MKRWKSLSCTSACSCNGKRRSISWRPQLFLKYGKGTSQTPLSFALSRRRQKPGLTSVQGGGFPGLAIAIMIANQKECCVHLIESNSRKCAFLSEAARRTGAPARVHNMRIADAASTGAVSAADVVTARALAPLEALLELALPFFGNASAGLFLKGREAGVEIADARKNWAFDLKIHPSMSDAQGRILEIRKPMLKQGGEQ